MNIYKLILIGSDSNTYITIIVQKCRQKRLNKLYKFKYPTELCDFYPKKKPSSLRYITWHRRFCRVEDSITTHAPFMVTFEACASR